MSHQSVEIDGDIKETSHIGQSNGFVAHSLVHENLSLLSCDIVCKQSDKHRQANKQCLGLSTSGTKVQNPPTHHDCLVHYPNQENPSSPRLSTIRQKSDFYITLYCK